MDDNKNKDLSHISDPSHMMQIKYAHNLSMFANREQ